LPCLSFYFLICGGIDFLIIAYVLLELFGRLSKGLLFF
jgi:hypothetical protein